MEKFQGIPSGELPFIPIPEILFEQIIPLIEDIDELKLTLYYFWAIAKQEGNVRYLRIDELLASDSLAEWMDGGLVEGALKKALARETLLLGQAQAIKKIRCIFPNSPQGQAAIQALRNGTWHPNETDHVPFTGQPQPQKNIYSLYEENIGPLTPMIAEDLAGAMEEYSLQWIEEAIHTAVQSNVRNWRYIDAILRSWKKEGKHADTRRNSKKDGGRISTGEFDEFIQH